MAEFDLAGFLKALKENPEALAQVRQQLDTPEDNPYTPVTPEQKVQHFTRLITHGMKEPKPYVHQAWPTTMFHLTKGAKVVANEAAAKALGPEWQTQPFAEVLEPEHDGMAEMDATVEVRRRPGRPAKAAPTAQ